METNGSTRSRSCQHAIIDTVLKIFPCLLLLFVSACQAELPSGGSGTQAPVIATAPDAMSGKQAGHSDSAEGQVQLQAEKGIRKRCSDAEFQLVAGANSGLHEGHVRTIPSVSQVQVMHGQQKLADIPIPSEMKGYVPVALGCAIANADHRAYFVVQYGERPYGCSFCEWFFLYDDNGQQLTHSNPPVLEDKSLPSIQRQYPNNNEYEAMIKDLGIEHPEMSAVE